ncbi:tetratricopeptide repeat protein [uncultured Algibacter sp.]|uniref:tetratricopeptide repeat protein n=1 Tax=uncultured Algibacter sp. TaxID=298659 RepID=UPI0026050B5D|nr:tetratricopeptide repeat protein [uncultured Algibacter sp.]
MYIIKHILAARRCFLHKQYKIAFKILKKAENLALEKHLFPLLNEIYHTQIQYAYANPITPLSTSIEKFRHNQKHYDLENELNMVYAKIRLTLNQINFKGAITDFQQILDEILEEHNINLSESMSFKSMYQLISIIGISSFTTNNYIRVEPFLINTYNSVIKHKSKSLYYHIQILYIIANTLFRNKKFDISKQYLNLMLTEMSGSKRKYYNSFKPKFDLLYALNLNCTRHQNKAIEILKEALHTKPTDTETLYDIKLSLIMCLFQKGNFKESHSTLSRLNHTDKWYLEKIGKEWTIKKNLIEILLLIELKYINLIESRLLSFKRRYYEYLKNIHQDRVITFLGFVESYYKHPEIVTSDSFKNKVETSFVWLKTHKEDIFVMSFYCWLKGKMNKTDLYETTLQLVSQT